MTNVRNSFVVMPQWTRVVHYKINKVCCFRCLKSSKLQWSSFLKQLSVPKILESFIKQPVQPPVCRPEVCWTTRKRPKLISDVALEQCWANVLTRKVAIVSKMCPKGRSSRVMQWLLTNLIRQRKRSFLSTKNEQEQTCLCWEDCLTEKSIK